MNAAANKIKKPFLWFLHADSRLNARSLTSLESSLRAEPDGLHYFDLAFLPDGPRLMILNQAGVWLRSHLLGLPFGDQGFCLKRELFLKLGGFDETAPYGEDHLLVWAAKRRQNPARSSRRQTVDEALENIKTRGGGEPR